MSENLVQSTYALLEDVFQLVSQLSKDAGLRKFVEQAKQCDRTMACVTYSILMCKKLKFEQATIVESLGLASFFQDISLYQSPFGNLAEIRPSELSGQAASYYLSHPTLSADLLAKSSAEISEVALQVVRQHHERIDRTGFPNRVGGAQLQPMAEILSLINLFLDYENSSDPETEIYAHYSDRIVTAFKQLQVGVRVTNTLG